jgi:hypothetical protein
MIPVRFKLKCALAMFMSGFLTANVALADKPEWAGGGNKGGKNKHSEQREEQRGERHDEARNDNDRSRAQRGHFDERHAVIVRDYYGEQMRGGPLSSRT